MAASLLDLFIAKLVVDQAMAWHQVHIPSNTTQGRAPSGEGSSCLQVFPSHLCNKYLPLGFPRLCFLFVG
jgi:hypothetical protein